MSDISKKNQNRNKRKFGEKQPETNKKQKTEGHPDYKYCNSEENNIIKDWFLSKLDKHFAIKPTCMKPVASIFEGVKFQETVTKKTLQELKNRDFLRKEATDEDKKLNRKAEKTRLTKWMKFIKKNNTAIVTYSRKTEHKWGRVQPKGSQSLGSIRCAVRGAVCGDYTDIDVKNCHPEILLQICQKLKIPCNALAHYVKNRAACLAEIKALYKDDVEPKEAYKASKTLFIKVMYGGRATEHESMLKDSSSPLPACVTDLADEVSTISRKLQRYNPQMKKDLLKDFQAKNKKREHKKYNWDGTFLSFYCQEWERRMLEVVYTLMKDEKIINKTNNCVLCFDGIMVGTARIKKEQELLLKCANAVEAELGLRLVFETKKLDRSLLEQLNSLKDAEPPLDIPDDKKKFFNSQYMSTLTSYNHQKQYIELFCAKCGSPQTAFMYSYWKQEVDEHGKNVSSFIIEARGPADLAKLLEHVPNADDPDQPFTKTWFRDPTIRYYHRVDFVPRNSVYTIDKKDTEVFNLFQGYSPDINTPLREDTPEYRAKMLKPFLDMAKELTEGDEGHRDFLMKLIALKVQYPNKKITRILPMMLGPQGIGKNFFFDVIADVIGKHHFKSSAKPTDFFGEHAEGYVHKLIAVFDENEKNEKWMSRMKADSANTHMTVNGKNQKPIEMRNVAMIFILSNKKRPVTINNAEENDTRFMAFWGTSKYRQPEYTHAFWVTMYKHCHSAEFIRCLYDYLMAFDLEEIDWKTERTKHLTQTYWNICADSIPTPLKFLKEFLLAVKHVAIGGTVRDQEQLIKTKKDEIHFELPLPHVRTDAAPFEAGPLDTTVNRVDPRKLQWAGQVRFKCKTIFDAYKEWCGYKQKDEEGFKSVQALKFYACLRDDLGLPVNELAPNNIMAWNFVPVDMLEHVNRKIGGQDKASDVDAEKHAELMQQFNI